MDSRPGAQQFWVGGFLLHTQTADRFVGKNEKVQEKEALSVWLSFEGESRVTAACQS